MISIGRSIYTNVSYIYMLYEMLKPKLPMLMQSFAIAMVLYIKRGLTTKELLVTAALIFSSLNVLETHAPQVFGMSKNGIGFSLGGGMLGGDPNGDSSQKKCRCKNRFATTTIASEAVGQLPPQTLRLMELLPAGRAILATNPEVQRQLQTILIETDPTLPEGPKSVPIEVPEPIQIKQAAPDTTSLCAALLKAGFNPKWTDRDVSYLQSTVAGRAVLIDIDQKVRNWTGLERVTKGDLMKCYPNYYSDYICARDTTIQTMPVSQTPTQMVPAVVITKHCNWRDITKDLEGSLRAQMLTPGRNDEAEIHTLHYLKSRTELEIRNLINLFQTKTRAEWKSYLFDLKSKESRGYHIEGTDHYIPWDFFTKHQACFGVAN